MTHNLVGEAREGWQESTQPCNRKTRGIYGWSLAGSPRVLAPSSPKASLAMSFMHSAGHSLTTLLPSVCRTPGTALSYPW